MTEPIALVVPVTNRFDMFTEMMETVDTPVQPFVIDQWRNNRGVSWAWNEGMRRARSSGYKYAVISNDDVKFNSGSLRGFHEVLVDTGAAFVSPNQIRLPRRDEVFEVEGIRAGADFFCFAVDIEQLVEGAGWFDENFYPAYFEDNDMHLRMQFAGLESYIATEYPVVHEGSMTQKFDKKNPVTDGVRYAANQTYFRAKWGGPPQKTEFTRPFNHQGLTVRDWDGSMALDGTSDDEKQSIFDNLEKWTYEIGVIHDSL